MELEKKIDWPKLSKITIMQIKTLAEIYNSSEEWIVECLVNEFYKDEVKRQKSIKERDER
jgi:hypothetical protein